jgi:hypothetical protein
MQTTWPEVARSLVGGIGSHIERRRVVFVLKAVRPHALTDDDDERQVASRST